VIVVEDEGQPLGRKVWRAILTDHRHEPNHCSPIARFISSLILAICLKALLPPNAGIERLPARYELPQRNPTTLVSNMLSASAFA